MHISCAIQFCHDFFCFRGHPNVSIDSNYGSEIPPYNVVFASYDTSPLNWLQLDLGVSRMISRVDIFGRIDFGTSERNRNLQVRKDVASKKCLLV